MLGLLGRWRISIAGRWYWARLAGFRTSPNLIRQYTGQQLPDPSQRYAIVAPSQDLCCVAGAGSGKTTVLTARIALLMDRLNVPSSRIRAVTFMKKAALEMEDRVQRSCPGVSLPVISTIHSLCYREILRLSGSVRLGSLTKWWASDHANDLRQKALRSPLIDAYRQAGGVSESGSNRDIVFELGRNLESLESARVNVEAFRLIAHSERTGQSVPLETIKRIGLSPHELLDRAAVRSERANAERSLGIFYVEALTRYHDFKQHQGTMDFNDLLEQAAMRLLQDAGLRQEMQRRYAHLLIDEYQDTSPLQILILEYLMRGPETSLFVVGDDWQSICGFQDADPRWLVGFRRRHPRAKRVVLGRNYRCRQPIVEVSTAMIRRHLALARLGDKRVVATDRGRQPIVEKVLINESEEATRIVEAVKRQLGGTGSSRGERIFVLARSNGWLGRLNRAFHESGVPYELRDETFTRAPLAQGGEEDLDEEEESPKAKVILTTIHRAKGLEAEFVHVAGLTDWLLPSRFRDTLIDRVRKRREEDHLAEELRVLYVGMTRARLGLTLWVPCWNGRQQPSRFLPHDNSWCQSISHVETRAQSKGRRSTRWGRPGSKFRAPRRGR